MILKIIYNDGSYILRDEIDAHWYCDDPDFSKVEPAMVHEIIEWNSTIAIHTEKYLVEE